MASIVGIPSTRVSDSFVRTRLMQQVQFDQRELFRVQTQLSTGRAFELPGEDPIAAGRIMSLQSLIERKEQVMVNLATNQSYISSTDVAVSRISNLMAEMRGVALSVIGTTSSDGQRAAAALQVQQAVHQLIDAGNQKFRGRFLFTGSTTQVQPFEMVENDVVQYFGNEEKLFSYSDIDVLFETNVDGNEVFGAISEPVRGSVDFNPILNFDTRLADLRQGRGISPGSITINDGTNSSTIDLSTAETIGDVAALIQANPPTNRTIQVEITPNGLRLEMSDDAPLPNVSILEVGGGTTAEELGILRATPVGVTPIVGSDLDPILRLTSNIRDVLGVRAQAVVHTVGPDNDFIIEADTRGAALNGVTLRFNDNPLVAPGSEIITWDAVAGTIDVDINENSSTAQNVVDSINAWNAAGNIPFTARLDPLDDSIFPGQGLIFKTPVAEVAATTAYGTGTEFDQNSGIQIENGRNRYTIGFTGAQTVEDILNALNGSEAGVLAEINRDQTGIDVRSRLSGADFAIGENGGTTATQLGIRTFETQTMLSDMNNGFGVMDYQGSGGAAKAEYQSVGVNNDLIIRARNTGTAENDYLVSFVDSGGGAGSESVAWDQVAKTITIAIAPGITTANDIINVFTSTSGPRDSFEIYLDDDDGEPNLGNGFVFVGDVTTTGGDSGGADFSITRADGTNLEIDIAGGSTIADVLAAINGHVDNVDGLLTASLAAFGNGIELIDDSYGTNQLTVSRAFLSVTAINLGLVAEGTESTPPTEPGVVAAGTAVFAGANNDLLIRGISPGTWPNGAQVDFVDTGAVPPTVIVDAVGKVLTFQIDAGVTTAADVIQAFNNDPTAAQYFSVQLSAADGAPNDGSGVVTAAVAAATLTGGLPQGITGTDNNPQETRGLFTGLLRLKRALEANDVLGVQRSLDVLDAAVLKMNFTRSDLGARQQGLDVLKYRLDSEEVELRSMLSNEHDIDMVEVVSNLTARQVALEAGLMATAKIFGMTLMNYL